MAVFGKGHRAQTSEEYGNDYKNILMLTFIKKYHFKDFCLKELQRPEFKSNLYILGWESL